MLDLSLSFSALHMNIVHEQRCPDIGPICETRDEPPQLHDQTLDVTELRLVGAYGFTERWGVELQLPLRLTGVGIVYRDLQGEVIEPDYANLHHRNETLVGLGDPWLRGRGSFDVLGLRASLFAGLSFPLGSTEDDPFELGREGLEHQHIQFGTGTFDPVLGAELSWQKASAQILGYVQSRLSLYENGHGYRAGTKTDAGALAAVSVIEWLRLGVSADVLHEEPPEWGGVVEQDGWLGRTDVLLGGQVTFISEGWELMLGLKTPVLISIIEAEEEAGDISYPGLITLGVRKSF